MKSVDLSLHYKEFSEHLNSIINDHKGTIWSNLKLRDDEEFPLNGWENLKYVVRIILSEVMCDTYKPAPETVLEAYSSALATFDCMNSLTPSQTQLSTL